MEKAEKVRKTVTRVSAVVLLAVLLVFTLQIGVNGNTISSLSLSKSAFGMVAVGCSSTVTCPDGSSSTCQATGDGANCHNGKCSDGEGNNSSASCGGGIILLKN